MADAGVAAVAAKVLGAAEGMEVVAMATASREACVAEETEEVDTAVAEVVAAQEAATAGEVETGGGHVAMVVVVQEQCTRVVTAVVPAAVPSSSLSE